DVGIQEVLDEPCAAEICNGSSIDVRCAITSQKQLFFLFRGISDETPSAARKHQVEFLRCEDREIPVADEERAIATDQQVVCVQIRVAHDEGWQSFLQLPSKRFGTSNQHANFVAVGS